MGIFDAFKNLGLSTKVNGFLLVLAILFAFFATRWLDIPPTKTFFAGIAFLLILSALVVHTIIAACRKYLHRNSSGTQGGA